MNNVIKAATRSNPEWAASERIPRLLVANPTTSLRPVRKIAAKTEPRAIRLFSFLSIEFFRLTSLLQKHKMKAPLTMDGRRACLTIVIQGYPNVPLPQQGYFKKSFRIGVKESMSRTCFVSGWTQWGMFGGTM